MLTVRRLDNVHIIYTEEPPNDRLLVLPFEERFELFSCFFIIIFMILNITVRRLEVYGKGSVN